MYPRARRNGGLAKSIARAFQGGPRIHCGGALGIAAGVVGGSVLATGSVLAQTSPESEAFPQLTLTLELAVRPTAVKALRDSGDAPLPLKLSGQIKPPPGRPARLGSASLQLAQAGMPMPMPPVAAPGSPVTPFPAPAAPPVGRPMPMAGGIPPSVAPSPSAFSRQAAPGSAGPLGPTAPAGATASPQSPLPFDQVLAPDRPRPPAVGATEPEELPDLSAEGWRLAPVRWGGTLTSTYNNFKENSGSNMITATEALNMRAASYVYQPWFAQVTGNLGLVSGTTERKGGLLQSNNDTRTTAVNYGGALSLFPLSRFPFQAFFDHGDSRASATSIGTQFTSTRLGLRQNYRPMQGPENYSFSYDRSVVTADSVRSVVDALQGTYAVALEEHTINANARYSDTSGGLNGEASRLISAFGSHTWRPDEDLSVSTSANFSDQRISYLSAGNLATNNNRLMQANSFFTWLPDEDLPLTVTGGGNLLNMAIETNAGSNELTNLGGFVGARYQFSERFTGTGNFQLAHTQSAGARLLLASGNGMLTYVGQPLTIGKYSYNWNTGANAMVQSASGGPAMQSLSGQFGHSLMRNVVFSPANIVNFNINQGVTIGTNSQWGGMSTLSHSAGVSWRLGYEDRISGLFSAMLTDNVTTGQYAGHYNTVSLTGNGRAQLSRRASVTLNANVTRSQQKQDYLLDQQLQLGSQIFDIGRPQWTGSAYLGYDHLSPFNIQRLSYNATLQYNSSQISQRILNGDPNAMSWQVSRSFQQRVLYRVGRLNFHVLNTFATVNGKKNASLFFQVSREFGDL